MQRRLILAVGIVALLLAPRSAQALPQPPYYLALGDSLAAGVQPMPDGTLVSTNQGYVDDLYGVYRLTHPFLRLQKLGCSGETSGTMITGGVCSYPAGNQLAQAVAFIQTHNVKLITLTIGGDNILQCIDPTGTVNDLCISNGLSGLGTDLPLILAQLRTAAGPTVRIVVGNYFDPILAAWALLPGPAGQALAYQSLDVVHILNSIIEGWAPVYGMPVADAAKTFRIDDFTNVPLINLPVNVVLSLTWTWMSASPPRGPDVHPRATGYVAIASAFVKAIGSF
jgi:lysophospholipase L1-like esterase